MSNVETPGGSPGFDVIYAEKLPERLLRGERSSEEVFDYGNCCRVQLRAVRAERRTRPESHATEYDGLATVNRNRGLIEFDTDSGVPGHLDGTMRTNDAEVSL